MLRTFRSRRRNRYVVHFCAVTAAVLLLLSVSFLHSRLSADRRTSSSTDAAASFDDPFEAEDSLLQDSDPDLRATTTTATSDDRIDELDVVDDDSRVSDEEEILRGLDSEGEDNSQSRISSSFSSRSSSGFYFDHASGVIRRAFDRQSIDEIDRWDNYATGFDAGLASQEDRSKVAFGSDDMPVDDEVRRKVVQVRGIEDALMLKLGSGVSPLREGWGPWFDAKSDFLRKDRMFKSNLEILNPLNNLLLQDPDGTGVTGLTRGDKLVLKGLLYEMKKVPFIGKKPLGFQDTGSEEADSDHLAKRGLSVNRTSWSRVGAAQGCYVDGDTGIKRNERRTLDDDDDAINNTGKSGSEYAALHSSGLKGVDGGSLRSKENNIEYSVGKMGEAGSQKVANSVAQSKSESVPMYAGGGRWGYFPGLHPYLSFSNFVDSFFRQAKCSLRVFMVWNSPPWMYTVRHQRGLESLLFHHPDACIIVFSETIELGFFKEFQKDGFKVAVAIPNLEELLKGTPTSIFASVWHEWRSTRFYPTHYSELVRLAALYKYGGVYLDCDIIVLKPISLFRNSVAAEEPSPRSPLNGALMAFKKHSSFIMDCLSEFYSTYDDTLLRWNGADLLSRVAGNFSRKANAADKQELKVHPSQFFFPVGSHDIQRYFKAAVTESEKAHQDSLFGKIINESYTLHHWNSLTSALVPEPESLVARIMNHYCIRCLDVL